MWVLRVLSGKDAGQTFKLKNGENTVGRTDSSDITIAHPKISKNHAVIHFNNGQVLLTDKGSSNGTFVNGVKIKDKTINQGDKISFFNIIVDIQDMPEQNQLAPIANQQAAVGQNHTQGFQDPHMNYQGQPSSYLPPQVQQQNHLYAVDPNSPHANGENHEVVTPPPKGVEGIQQVIEEYMESVVLPGVYKLTEIMEFRWVLAIFMAVFILLVTSLSSLPLVRILKSSIEQESQNRAATIARNLARENRASLQINNESGLVTEMAEREPGVLKALIINRQGSIIAPPKEVGNYPEYAFIHEARKTGNPEIDQVDSGTVIAVEPIKFYNSRTGSQTTSAHAVVIYNMETLAANDDRTISLYIQTFFIALILGAILFFFIYKLMEYPIKTINAQLDQSLKDRTANIQISFDFPILQKLITNINSSLNRNNTDDSNDNFSVEYDRNSEMNNIIQLLGFEAIVINAGDETIAAGNDHFWDKTGLDPMITIGNSFLEITDQALKLNIKDLIDRISNDPTQLQQNELEIGGSPYQVTGQAIYGTSEVSYYIITLIPDYDGGI